MNVDIINESSLIIKKTMIFKDKSEERSLEMCGGQLLYLNWIEEVARNTVGRLVRPHWPQVGQIDKGCFAFNVYLCRSWQHWCHLAELGFSTPVWLERVYGNLNRSVKCITIELLSGQPTHNYLNFKWSVALLCWVVLGLEFKSDLSGVYLRDVIWHSGKKTHHTRVWS